MLLATRCHAAHLTMWKTTGRSFFSRTICVRQNRNAQTGTEVEVEVEDLLEVCAEAGQRAGSIIRAVWASRDWGLVDKGRGNALYAGASHSALDPCTMADIRAQRLITKMVRAVWPHLQLVGEETLPDSPSPHPHSPPAETASGALGEKGGEEKQAEKKRDGDEKTLVVTSSPCPSDLEPYFLQDDALIQEGVGHAYKNSLAPKKRRGSGRKVPMERVCLYIDPLDGTKEFTRGNLYAVTVLIGIAVDGVPLAGVIAQPFVREGEPLSIAQKVPGDNYLIDPLSLDFGRCRLLQGIAGEGLFCDGLLLDSPQMRPTPLTMAVASVSYKAVQNITNKMKENNLISNILEHPGAGFKFLQLITGEADAYFTMMPMNLWDSCAPEACLSALGGRTTDRYGSPIFYPSSDLSLSKYKSNPHGLVASRSPLSHKLFVDAICDLYPPPSSSPPSPA